MSGIDAAEIKAAIAMPELCRRDGVELRKRGNLFEALCPFHQERTPSFTVWLDHAHCFGCGWHGSIFDYWMERRGGLEFKDAAAELAEMAGLSGSKNPPSLRLQRTMVTPLPLQPSRKKEKPALPNLSPLDNRDAALLAAVRGLPVEVVKHVASLRLIRFCQWPQWHRRDSWHWWWNFADPCYPSWVITDDSGNVAQFRRLDGCKYVLQERGIKAWTKGSPGWPVGAADLMPEIRNVLLVEGGPDLLAAYHFLLADWRLKNGRPLVVPQILPVAMLGASCNIAEELIRPEGRPSPFAGKRVRIVIHNDEPNKQTGRVPSFEAAAKWTEQLCAAGAAVETFSLEGIQAEAESGKQKTEVKDLNDLALCPPEIWQAPEIRAAFFEWRF